MGAVAGPVGRPARRPSAFSASSAVRWGWAVADARAARGCPDAKTPLRAHGCVGRGVFKRAGGDVLSHPVARAVPSARRGLTTVFGMGTGVALAPLPPAKLRGGERSGALAVFLLGGAGASWTDQASWAISTARLRRLPALHLPPINVLVSNGPSEVLRPGSARLGGGFPLRCFQRFSRPDLATRRCPWQDSRYTRGQSVPVLSY